MTQTINEMLEHVLKAEGGFVNDPADKGGATNFGVTQKVLEGWRGHSVTVDDVKNMKVDEAKDIYKDQYFIKPKIDTINEHLQPHTFDMGVNHGPSRAIKILQQSIKDLGQPCSVDGGIGPNTRKLLDAAITQHGWKIVNNKTVDNRITFYNSIVENNESQRKFLKGWINRAESFRV